MIEQSAASADGSPAARDPTEWGQLEFRRLLEKFPAGAYTCDPAGLITYFNPRAAEVWGRAPRLNDPEDRFCGSFRLFTAEGAPVDHDRCWMAMALHSNRGYNGHEIVVERPDGRRLTVLAYANPIRHESGKLLGAVNVLVDISERKLAEEALQQADSAKDEFLATLAHELRNPLAPLRNAVRIMRLQSEPAANPDARWALDVMDRQTGQMARLIDDLLDISRITRNKLELRKERIELTDVIRAAIETSRPVIESTGHQLTVAECADPLALDADPTRLAQAISNLLNNAAKYTDPGGHVFLLVERQGSDAVVSIRDTGIGIPAEMLPRIFDMFTQVEPSLDKSRGGLGIGLTLVKRLIEMHGGSVHAHSDGPGRGSEFIVRLPVLVAASLPAAPVEHAPQPRNCGPALRILVADDNHDSAASLAMLLRISGSDVRSAADGLEAVAASADFRPDVMLLDIGMPRLNGYEAARHIRQQPWGKSVVLIAVTGWGQETDRRRSHDAGFDHHLVKPIDASALLSLLSTLCRAAGQNTVALGV